MKYSRFSILKSLVGKKSILKTPIPLKSIIFLSVISIFSTVISLASPYMYSLLVDNVMTKGNTKLLLTIIPIMMGIFVISVGISALSTFVSVRFSNRVNLSVKNEMFQKLMEKDIADIMNLDVGYEQKLIEQDSAVVSAFFIGQIKDFLCAFLFAAVYLALMFVINPWLTLISLFFIPISILFGQYMGKRFNEYQKKLWQIGSVNNTFLFDTIQKWREIKVQNLEANLSKEFESKLYPEQAINLKWMKYFAMNGVFYDFKNSFVQSLLLYFIGGILIIYEQITIGTLLMFMSYMSSFSLNIDSIINSIMGFESNRAIFERLFKVLKAQKRVKENFELNDYNIKIDNLSYAYREELPNVLTNISYQFDYGKKYLIAGKSGEGKSTLIKLILGMLYPNVGKIKLGDVHLENICQQFLFKKICAVMQENYYFNLTIKENLTMIAPDATDSDIEKACELACISKFIDSLPQGYDTLIGERGIKLSGGQKQRLGIARLILHNPNIIILDEATSSLDSIVEAKILSNLKFLFEDKTLIIISHKSTIQIDFYKCIVVENNTLLMGGKIGE